MTKNRTVIITGGTGSFGHTVARRLLERDDISEIRILGRMNNMNILIIVSDSTWEMSGIMQASNGLCEAWIMHFTLQR